MNLGRARPAQGAHPAARPAKLNLIFRGVLQEFRLVLLVGELITIAEVVGEDGLLSLCFLAAHQLDWIALEKQRRITRLAHCRFDAEQD